MIRYSEVTNQNLALRSFRSGIELALRLASGVIVGQPVDPDTRKPAPLPVLRPQVRRYCQPVSRMSSRTRQLRARNPAGLRHIQSRDGFTLYPCMSELLTVTTNQHARRITWR
jgi:hypothetical protein